jgi:hypothetical protein
MRPQSSEITWCLNHHLPEDRASPLGRVCARCHRRLRVAPPPGRPMAYWESQPVACRLDGEPCFVYTLRWDEFQIRSLHVVDQTTHAFARQ